MDGKISKEMFEKKNSNSSFCNPVTRSIALILKLVTECSLPACASLIC